MSERIGKYYYRFICACLLSLLATGIFAFFWYDFIEEHNQTGHLLGYGNLIMAIGLYLILFVIVGKWLRAFKIGVERISKIVASVVLSLVVTDFLEVFISMAITGQFRFGLKFLLVYSLMLLIQIIILSILSILMVKLYRAIIPPLKVLEIIGENENLLAKKMSGIKNKYQIVETLSADTDIQILIDKISECEAVLINDVPAKTQNDIVKKCFELNKRTYIVPKISDIIIKSSDGLNVVDTPLYLCRNFQIRPWQRFVKRLVDIFFGGIALIVLSPVFLITAIAIKLEDHGPVFFKQERVTLNEKRFMILKFRSMIVDAEKDGRPHPAGEKDDRITKVGRVIRACRIDELPQLINILKGEMSIVGPRPERWEHVEKYTEEIPEFSFRHKVKGGLTGYAQVYGKYNTSALDKLKLDLEYITNYSLLLDFQIVFETVKILFQKESTEGFSENNIKKMHDGQ